MARPGSDARERAIKAALTLAKKDGAIGFTLEAVAREAGLSKGGLLHHFKTKESLLEALIADMVARFEAAILQLAEVDPKPTGRFTRAFLRAIATADLAENSKVLLSAVALNPTLLRPLRESQKRCFVQFSSDGIDPLTAHMIALCADAMWLHTIFDLPGPGEPAQIALRAKMEALTYKKAPGRK